MPLFEYACDACGNIFEKLVMAPAREEVACDRCGGSRITRRFSTFSARTAGPASAPGPDERGRASGDGCCSPGSCGCR